MNCLRYLFLFFCGNVSAQQADVFDFVEQMPLITNGVCDSLKTASEAKKCSDAALRSFFANHLQIASNSRFCADGTIFFKFIVNEEGQTENLSFSIPAHDSLCPDYVASIEKMLPLLQSKLHWKAGMQGGKAVKVRMLIPLRICWRDE